MTTDQTHARPFAPIVTLGPCGTSVLFVEDAADTALAHLSVNHGIDVADPAARISEHVAVADLDFFDSRGRRLRRQALDGSVVLVVGDERDRRDELCARIDETFAHVRAQVFSDPELLKNAPDVDAWDIRPPAHPRESAHQATDADYERYFSALQDLLSSGPADHVGSWWHNLFHR